MVVSLQGSGYSQEHAKRQGSTWFPVETNRFQLAIVFVPCSEKSVVLPQKLLPPVIFSIYESSVEHPSEPRPKLEVEIALAPQRRCSYDESL